MGISIGSGGAHPSFLYEPFWIGWAGNTTLTGAIPFDTDKLNGDVPLADLTTGLGGAIWWSEGDKTVYFEPVNFDLVPWVGAPGDFYNVSYDVTFRNDGATDLPVDFHLDLSSGASDAHLFHRALILQPAAVKRWSEARTLAVVKGGLVSLVMDDALDEDIVVVSAELRVQRVHLG